MRFSVAIPCFFGKDDFCDALRKISRLGYDAAETYKWEHLDLDRVKRAIDETGVELVSMCTTEFTMNVPALRPKWLDGLAKTCIAAKKLGVKKLITQVGMETKDERKYQHESIVAALKEAKPILEDAGVTIMIEPLNLRVNHPGYYLARSDEAFEIIKESENPYAKVVYDIYHQQISEGNILPTISSNLEHIAHLHAAAHPGRIDLWLGENDYKFIFGKIDSLGYRGLCGLEYRPTLTPEESLRRVRELYG